MLEILNRQCKSLWTVPQDVILQITVFAQLASTNRTALTTGAFWSPGVQHL